MMLTLLISSIVSVNIVWAESPWMKTYLNEAYDNVDDIAEELKTLFILQPAFKKVPRLSDFDDFNKSVTVDHPAINELFQTTKQNIKERYDPVYKKLNGKHIKDIEMHGLSTVFIDKNVDISSNLNKIFVHLPLGFQYLNIFSNIVYKYLRIGINGKANVLVKKLKVAVDIFLNPDSQGSTPAGLDNFKVTNWGDMDIKFSGTNMLGKMLQGMVPRFSALFKKVIASNVQGIVQKNINEELAKIEELPEKVAQFVKKIIEI